MLKVKIMDEDPGNHDDRLGVTRIWTGQLDAEGVVAGEGGEKELDKPQTLNTARGTWVGLLRVATVIAGCGQWRGLNGQVDVGIRVEEIQKEETDMGSLDRAYTISPSMPPVILSVRWDTLTVVVVEKIGGANTSPH